MHFILLSIKAEESSNITEQLLLSFS